MPKERILPRDLFGMVSAKTWSFDVFNFCPVHKVKFNKKNWEKTDQNQSSWNCRYEILIISILLKLWTLSTAVSKCCAEATQDAIVQSLFIYSVPRFGLWTIEGSKWGPRNSREVRSTNATLKTSHMYLHPDNECAESSVTFSPPVFLGFCNSYLKVWQKKWLPLNYNSWFFPVLAQNLSAIGFDFSFPIIFWYFVFEKVKYLH